MVREEMQRWYCKNNLSSDEASDRADLLYLSARKARNEGRLVEASEFYLVCADACEEIGHHASAVLYRYTARECVTHPLQEWVVNSTVCYGPKQ